MRGSLSLSDENCSSGNGNPTERPSPPPSPAGRGGERIGIPEFPDLDFDTGDFVARLRIDQLDSVWFPTKGYFVNADFRGSRTALGASDSFNRGALVAFGAQTLGRWTGLARVTYGDGFGSRLPFYGLSSLGGS